MNCRLTSPTKFVNAATFCQMLEHIYMVNHQTSGDMQNNSFKLIKQPHGSI